MEGEVEQKGKERALGRRTWVLDGRRDDQSRGLEKEGGGGGRRLREDRRRRKRKRKRERARKR